MATRNNKRNGAQNESTNAASKQQVKNRKSSNAPAPTQDGTPVPAKLEELQSRYDEYNTGLNEVQKQAKKMAEKVAKQRDLVINERYCIAVSRFNMGTATPEDLAIITSRKAEDNATEGLAKFFAKTFEDSDEVAKARKDVRDEEGSLASAIAETKRLWNNGYAVLYGSIGMTKRSLDRIPNLLKAGLCCYLQVGTADGLKAATVNRTAVRKNGKAVKVKGKRVYKYTLRERTRWSAYGLFETLERNHRLDGFYTEDELKVRRELLEEQSKALAAYKAAKETAEKSDVPEQKQEAANAAQKLAGAAKAAGRKAKENANTNTQHTTKGGELKKVANG